MGDECSGATTGPDGVASTIVNLALLGGTVLSFVPQWISIIQEKSSRGISVFAQSFGTVGCFTQFYCALLLILRCGLFGGFPPYKNVGAVCETNFFTWDCQQLLLAMYLTGSFVVGQVPILLLIGIYFRPEVEANIVKETRFMRICMIFTWTFIAILLLVGLGMLLFARTYDVFHYFGMVITPIGAVSMGSTYIPQIVTTFRLKKKGALSLLTLALQVPGVAGVVLSLIFDGQSWDVVLPSCASFVTGSFLLGEVLFYEIRGKTRRKATLQHEFTSPLLYDADKNQSFEVLYP